MLDGRRDCVGGAHSAMRMRSPGNLAWRGKELPRTPEEREPGRGKSNEPERILPRDCIDGRGTAAEEPGREGPFVLEMLVPGRWPWLCGRLLEDSLIALTRELLMM